MPNKYSISLLLTLLLPIANNIYGQSILINEFMAKNNTTLQDEDGDYHDWIELYNPTNTAINLLNYSLSDDETVLDKWIFPEITISPQSYLLIFASSKNRLDTAELHTNFKISSDGERLYLSNNIGTLINQTDSVYLAADESYSRVPDGEINMTVTNIPSPNSTNNNSNVLSFSNQEGFYVSPFSLEVNSLLGDTIFYTLNGDIPSVNSNIMDGSIIIDDLSAFPNVISEIPTTPAQELISYPAWMSPSEITNKATILRCASFRNGTRTSVIYSKTFFVDSAIIDKYTLPIISLMTPQESLFDPDSGIFVPGVNFDADDPQWTGNYFMRGEQWEKEIHFEYFDNDGNPILSQDAGIRIHGGKTRQASQKSLRLYARSEYGNTYFHHQLLPQKEVDKYKRFLLRTTMGAWHGQTIIQDVLTQDISASLNIDSQDYQPVILFINGEYWGVHTLRDRIDERYIEYTHHIDKDSIEFKEWGNVNYENLIVFIENNSLEEDINYEYIETKIDIDNYVDYTISELFFANIDWPANNMKLWRKIPDGKWRWILYDLDAGFLDTNYNMLEHATTTTPSDNWTNPAPKTFLFRSLLKNDHFKSLFIQRFAELLNNEFKVDVMKNKLDSIQDIYYPEISDHIGRWNYPTSISMWEEDIENKILSFLEKRPCAIRENIMTFFDLSTFDFHCEAMSTTLGNIILAPNPNTGSFFITNYGVDIKDATITMTNMSGQTVYEENNIDLMNNERKYIDLLSLSSDVYILKIISNTISDKKKVVIVK